MKNKILVTSALLVAISFHAGSVNAQQNRASTESRSYMTDDSGESLLNFSEDGHRYKIRLEGSKIVEMYVDGKKVAEEDYVKYDTMIKKILVQIEKDRKQAEEDRAQAEKDRARAEKDRQQANIDREQAVKDRERAELDRKQAEKDRAQAEIHRSQADNDRKRAEQDRLQAEKDRTHAEEDRKRAEVDRAHAEVDRKRAEEDRKQVEDMVNELVSEKLIESKDALRSLTLDNTELTVNGVKQSAELHSKFKSKYLKNGHSRINYRHADRFTQLEIQ